MFDYNSSETILNSLYLTDGVTSQWSILSKVADTSLAPVAGEDPFINYFGGDKALHVTRVAKYIDKFITQVWRNPYTTLAYEQQTIYTPAALTGGVVYRLSIDAILDQGSHDAQYSRWAIHKGKPYLIEFTSTTTVTAGANAAAYIVAQCKKGLKNPDLGELELTFQVSGGTNVTITSKNAFVHFKEVVIEELYPIGSGSGQDMEGDVKTYHTTFATSGAVATTAVVTTVGDIGFGSYDWMIRNLRIPTVEAIRFGGTFQDELPRPGSYYTQFVIEYEKTREITGSNVIGAPAVSKTRHTFFVLDTNAQNVTNPAYKFYADIQTVLGGGGVMEPFVTNVPDADAGSTLSGTNDGILATTGDNLPD